MRILLDTHVFLWYISNDQKLPRFAYDAIRDKSNDVYLSVVSVWEIVVKHQIGKLPLPGPAYEYVQDRQAAHRITSLPLEAGAVAHLATLEMYHADPFDRMLICQAIHHELVVATVDYQFSGYSVPLLSLPR
jgi:PIN domain nuclease of toxin-antitoxin system